MITEKQKQLVINHDKCDGELYIQGNMFAARGLWCSGIVCSNCNGLWVNSEDNFFEKIKKCC